MHKRFFEKLENKDKGYTNNILFRLKSGFTPWDLEKEYYRLTGLKRFVYSDEESIDSIKKSELVIVTYDSTVFLESLTPECSDFASLSEKNIGREQSFPQIF